jgi:invasion protein IalB
MSNILKIISIAGFIAASSAAFAQTTAPETDAAITAENPLGLSMGQPVGDENAPGTTYIQGEFGDWQLRCIRVEEGEKEPCQLYQLLKDDKGNGVVEINMFALPEGQAAAAGATIVTPLETMLTQQLVMSIDGGPAKRFPFTWCGLTGCFARIGFSNADIATFKRGAKGTITIVPVIAPDQKVVVSMSLTGFTKGYEAVTEANK